MHRSSRSRASPRSATRWRASMPRGRSGSSGEASRRRGLRAGPAEAGVEALHGALLRDLPLADLAAVLAPAALYVGNDSGVSHLAGAVGAAGLVLFGPTQARRWRPLAGSLTPLQALGTEDPEGIALAALPPALVVAECERIGGRLGGARPRSPVDKGGPRY